MRFFSFITAALIATVAGAPALAQVPGPTPPPGPGQVKTVDVAHSTTLGGSDAKAAEAAETMERASDIWTPVNIQFRDCPSVVNPANVVIKNRQTPPDCTTLAALLQNGRLKLGPAPPQGTPEGLTDIVDADCNPTGFNLDDLMRSWIEYSCEVEGVPATDPKPVFALALLDIFSGTDSQGNEVNPLDGYGDSRGGVIFGICQLTSGSVAAHELGHAHGVNHPLATEPEFADPNNLMQPTGTSPVPGTCEYYTTRFGLTTAQGAKAMPKACAYKSRNTPPVTTRWATLRIQITQIKTTADAEIAILVSEKAGLRSDLDDAQSAVNAAQTVVTQIEQVEIPAIQAKITAAEAAITAFVNATKTDIDAWIAIRKMDPSTMTGQEVAAARKKANGIRKKYKDLFKGYIKKREKQLLAACAITPAQAKEGLDETSPGDSEAAMAYSQLRNALLTVQAELAVAERTLAAAKESLAAAEAARDAAADAHSAKCDELDARRAKKDDDVERVIRESGVTKY